MFSAIPSLLIDDGLVMKMPSPKQLSDFMKKLITTTIALMTGALVAAYAGNAKENWDKSCAKCHGQDGKGQTKIGQKLDIKDFTDAKVQGELKDDEAFKAIKDGIRDKEGRLRMKAAEGLSDDEIKALVQYVHDFKK